MKFRSTLSLLGLAAVLFAFIFFLERPFREARNQKPDFRIFPDLKADAVNDIQVRPAGKLDIRAEKTNGFWHLIRPVSYPAQAQNVEALINALAGLNWEAHINSQELKSRPKAAEEFGFDSPQFSVLIQQGDLTRHFLIGSTTVAGDEMFLQVLGGDGYYLVKSELLKWLPQKADDWRERSALPLQVFSANTFEVRSGGKGFRLEQNPTNHIWKMTRPLVGRADNAKIENLFIQLSGADVVGFVAEDPNMDSEKFGLPNTPAQTPDLELSFFDGTNLLGGVQLGLAFTNNTNFVFGRRLNEQAIFLVAKEAFEPWRASFADFRDRHLINLPTDAVTNIQVRGQDSFKVQRQSETSWLTTQPENFQADTDLMHDLLLVLTRIEVEFGNDVVTDFEPFGLKNPVLEYAITGKETNAISGAVDARTERLVFGTNSTGKVFVRRNDEARVYTLNSQEFELLPRVSWQLRDRQVWNFKASDVASVTIAQKGRTRKIIHNSTNDWSLADGSQGVLNPFALEEAMHRLGELKAIYWTARGDENADRFGFKQTDHQISIELKRDGKAETLTLQFGNYSDFYHPYAMTIVRGEPMIFEFPLPLFSEFVRADCLSIFPPSLPTAK